MKELARKILKAGLPVPRFMRPVIRGTYMCGIILKETAVFLRKFFWVEVVVRSVCQTVGKGLMIDRIPFIRGEGIIRIGNNVHLSGRSCFYFMSGVPEKPVIEVGDGVFIGNGCTLSAGRKITIGNGVLMSAGVRIHDNDGHSLDIERRRKGTPQTSDEMSPVVIEDDVWIGADSIILKGVNIGRGAVIGAGSVVTRDVPSNCVAAGNPATIVKSA